MIECQEETEQDLLDRVQEQEEVWEEEEPSQEEAAEWAEVPEWAGWEARLPVSEVIVCARAVVKKCPISREYHAIRLNAQNAALL